MLSSGMTTTQAAGLGNADAPLARSVRFTQRPISDERYELLGELASGGMATVYLARMRRPMGFSRLVAVKTMHPQFAKDPSFSTMFLDEARLTAQLRHPNIVPTFDIVSDEGQLHLVMEYVEGESLAGLLRAARAAGTRLPTPIACAIVHDTLLGLHEAHEAKDEEGMPLAIVHRDVSPQNVMVGIDGLARVLDFGVAKAKSMVHPSNDHEIKGKIPYMPPEQLYGECVDRRVDVYAAGVLLWEALACARLFEGPCETALVKRITEDEVAPPSSRVPEIPAALDAIVMQALSRDANGRFDTALEMAEAIARTVTLPSRTEVSAWVKRFARPRAVPPSSDRFLSRVNAEAPTVVAGAEQIPPPRPSVPAPPPPAPPSSPTRDDRTPHGLTTPQLPPEPTRPMTRPLARTPAPSRTRRFFRTIGTVAAGSVGTLALVGIALASVGTPVPVHLAKPRAPETPVSILAARPAVLPSGSPVTDTTEAADTTDATPPRATLTKEPALPADGASKTSPRPGLKKAWRRAPTIGSSSSVDPAQATPSSSATTSPDSCRPPFTVDALGHRHYKAECL